MAALRGLLQRPLASYYLLLACVGLLLVIGLVMVFSATSLTSYTDTGNAFADVLKQGTFALIGFVAFWFCQRLPVRTFRGIAKPAIIIAFLLMFLVDALGFAAVLAATPGETPEPIHLGPVHASQLWLHLGPVQLQPAEPAKLALVLWGAQVLVTKGPAIANLRDLMTPLFPVTFALFGLVGYNDLGSMLCLLVAFVGLLWAAGVRLRVFLGMFVVALAGVIGLILMPGKHFYRVERLVVFFDPSRADRADGAYQYFQGLYAVAEGGWFGVGLGEGHLKWGRLPNGHNDFIFAVIAEELGVMGCLVVLGLFAVLAYTGLRIARRVADPFRRLVAASITIWFVGQAVINIGGVVGLLPITGLPLPFISDGGTALVVALTAAGILLSFARAEPDAARALHARPPRRWVRLVWAPLPPLPRSRPDHERAPKTGRSG
ncbi:MAG: cell division protein FtsW [Dactylosporangium sp.]|nr:putative lipid II flippase FtsW [Dactylosporangium sp.]NNJ63600.1 cell division protein FtsW [Dactylosporangium sp.]